MSFIVDRIRSALRGPRNEAPPDVRRFIAEKGNLKIKQIVLARTPVQKSVIVFLNLISLGKLDIIRRKLGYDDLFHLYMGVELEDGSWWRIEKNEVVKVRPIGEEGLQAREVLGVNFFKHDAPTIGQMFDNAYKANPRLWLYDAKTDNCQKFIRDMLANSGLLNEHADKFIMQDAVSIFKGLPEYVHKFGKLLTDIAATGDILIQGRGILKKRSGGNVDQKSDSKNDGESGIIQAILFDMELFDTSKARRWLKKHNYTPLKRVHKSRNRLRYRLEEPDKFSKLITKKTKEGITFIIGYV